MVYREHHQAIRSYCFRRLAPSDANDATAEVFLLAWKKLDDVPVGPGTLPYLYTMARNVVANARRANARRGQLNGRLRSQPVELITGPEVQVVQREEVRRVLTVLDELSETDQELLRLKAWERLSSPEIAEVTGLTVRAVETRLSRARKKLAQKAARRAGPSARSGSRSAQRGGER
jgi:RNA polymerase sigma-70 factor (ECF subfamily)